MKIKVVSFDIFQTLVDVNQRIPQIWKGILGDSYTSLKGIMGAQAVVSVYPAILEKAIASGSFYNMEEVYLQCARSAIEETGYPVSPESIVDNLLYQHSQAPLYEDVITCMEKLHKNYRIILSSDSGHSMVDELIPQFIYDHLFISDDIFCYKSNPNGQFFKYVLEQLKVSPNEMIHIGDSFSDIIGAKQAGVTSCWLNRNFLLWNYDITPDYIITSLSEVEQILSNKSI